MSDKAFRRLTGLLFILGALLVNVPYALLIANFDYPDILRQPTVEVLTRFSAGGTGLISTWLAFAWVGFPLLLAIPFLHNILERRDTPYLLAGTLAGVFGAVLQMVGLLRWTFVVPILAALYTDPMGSEATKAAAVIVFQAVHQYGGVVIGEHLGQMFTIVWMVLVSLAMFRAPLFRPWLAWSGIAAAAVYLLAQSELFATILPDFPVMPEAGLVGSLLWLAWLVLVGIMLLRGKVQMA